MQRINTICIRSLVVLLVSLGSVCGQGTLRTIRFDGGLTYPPGTQSSNWNFYTEPVMFTVNGYPAGFTRTWSGGPQVPDNGTAYLQGRPGDFLRFTQNGYVFGLVSVDLAEYTTSSLTPVTIRFVGLNYNGDIVATTEFTTAGIADDLGRPAFQTFYFPPEFQSRQFNSVYVNPNFISSAGWSLDNLTIYGVPEPSVLALGCCGGLLLAVRWLRVRRH